MFRPVNNANPFIFNDNINRQINNSSNSIQTNFVTGAISEIAVKFRISINGDPNIGKILKSGKGIRVAHALVFEGCKAYLTRL